MARTTSSRSRVFWPFSTPPLATGGSHFQGKRRAIRSWIGGKRVSVRELDQPNRPIAIYATGISEIRIPVGVFYPSFDRPQDFTLLLSMMYLLLAGLHFGHVLAWTRFAQFNECKGS